VLQQKLAQQLLAQQPQARAPPMQVPLRSKCYPDFKLWPEESGVAQKQNRRRR
jgi:hypothetical protein